MMLFATNDFASTSHKKGDATYQRYRKGYRTDTYLVKTVGENRLLIVFSIRNDNPA